jgi:hypothetical protein
MLNPSKTHILNRIVDPELPPASNSHPAKINHVQNLLGCSYLPLCKFSFSNCPAQNPLLGAKAACP